MAGKFTFPYLDAKSIHDLFYKLSWNFAYKLIPFRRLKHRTFDILEFYGALQILYQSKIVQNTVLKTNAL